MLSNNVGRAEERPKLLLTGGSKSGKQFWTRTKKKFDTIFVGQEKVEVTSRPLRPRGHSSVNLAPSHSIKLFRASKGKKKKTRPHPASKAVRSPRKRRPQPPSSHERPSKRGLCLFLPPDVQTISYNVSLGRKRGEKTRTKKRLRRARARA